MSSEERNEGEAAGGRRTEVRVSDVLGAVAQIELQLAAVRHVLEQMHPSTVMAIIAHPEGTPRPYPAGMC